VATESGNIIFWEGMTFPAETVIIIMAYLYAKRIFSVTYSVRLNTERPNTVGLDLGFLTESNKPYSVNGVTGPILKSTTEVTWAGRESKSPSQRAPVGDPVKRGGGGGKVIQNKRRAKNDVEPRVHWTLNTAHQFIIIDHLHQDT
jgi:hypothetical protein